MANTGRIPLWLVGLVGGLAVITMLSFVRGDHRPSRHEAAVAVAGDADAAAVRPRVGAQPVDGVLQVPELRVAELLVRGGRPLQTLARS